MAEKSILILGNHPPPFGGVPSHIRHLSFYLAARGWDVHVLSLAGTPRPPERIDGYTVHRPSRVKRWAKAVLWPADAVRLARTCPEFARNDPRLFLGAVAMANAARELMQEYGLKLISAYHVLTPGLAGAWLAEEFRAPLVITNFGEVYAEPEAYAKRVDAVRFALKRSARLVSCSAHCARSYERLGIEDPVDVVYYGVDLERFRERDAGAARASFGLSPDDEVALYAGRMVREMGLHTFLDTVPLVLVERPSVRFLVAGQRGALTGRALAAQAAYPQSVRVSIDVSDERLAEHYAAATIGVAPSINERACLGLALAEAMATGRPVIGARVGGTPEVVREGETGLLVPPEDPRALAGAIVRLLADPRREEMGRRGRAFVEQTLSKDAANAAMERIFERALAR